MDKNKLDEIEMVLSEAMDKVKAQGWRIVRHQNANLSTKCCCALGAALISDNPNPDPNIGMASWIGKKFQFSEDELYAFLSGFDGGINKDYYDQEIFNLGNKLAKRYVD